MANLADIAVRRKVHLQIKAPEEALKWTRIISIGVQLKSNVKRERFTSRVIH